MNVDVDTYYHIRRFCFIQVYKLLIPFNFGTFDYVDGARGQKFIFVSFMLFIHLFTMLIKYRPNGHLIN